MFNIPWSLGNTQASDGGVKGGIPRSSLRLPCPVTKELLWEPRRHKARCPRLLPVLDGRRYISPLRRDRQRKRERPRLGGWSHYRPFRVDVAVVSEIPRLRKIWCLRQVCRLVRRVWTVAAQCSVPIRIAAAHNAGSQVARRKCPFEDVIATRCQHENLA